MNVALVVLDTLRKDTFERHFDWLPGLRFERAFSTGNWTVPAHASLFTGRYPGEVGVHAKHTTLDCPEQTLAERLAGAGYMTRAFSSNVNVSPPFKFDRGFREFEVSHRLRGLSPDVFDWETFISSHRDEGPVRYLRALYRCVFGKCDTRASLRRGWEIKKRDLGWATEQPDAGAKEALAWIRETAFGSNEFLFCNLMEAHAPYAPPEAYRTTGADVTDVTTFNALLATIEGGPPAADDDLLRRAYDDAVKYLSDVYRSLFEELRESFDLVITVGDHGECFGEDGIYQHAVGMRPELVHVPLVVSGDDLEGTHAGAVSLLDVHATVLDVAGIDTAGHGHSLLGGSPSRTAFAEYHGVSEQNRQAVESEGHDPDPYDHRLCAVGTGDAYGYETFDGFKPADASDLRRAVDEHLATTEWREPGPDDEIPETVRRRLEDLGYA
ncbi:MAG: sulfatase-like hydrolase/transferase [Haloarculaceae archaeon]